MLSPSRIPSGSVGCARHFLEPHERDVAVTSGPRTGNVRSEATYGHDVVVALAGTTRAPRLYG